MKGTKILYSSTELLYVFNNRAMPREELAASFNKKFQRAIHKDNIKALCVRHGWKTGRTGHFQKGHIPSPNARPKGPNKTSFKKGIVPHNFLPVGHERINTEGYKEIKMSLKKNDWKQKHRIEWEKHHGPLNRNDIIRFKDANPLNCHIDNLEKYNLAEHIELNRLGYNNADSDIKPTISAIARIHAKTSQLKRGRA